MFSSGWTGQIRLPRASVLVLGLMAALMVSASYATAGVPKNYSPDQVGQSGQANPSNNGRFRQPEIAPRVVDGHDASVRELPFVVSLVAREMGNGKKIRSAYWGQYCTGILLTRTVVLTALHCGAYASSRSSNTDVVIGRSNLSEHRRGERITLIDNEDLDKPDSNGDGRWDYGGDLALLRLARPARKGRPIGLRRLGSPQEGTVRVAGWGYTRNTRPNRLQKADLPRLSDETCAETYPRGPRWNRFYFIRGTHICAGFQERGADACMGDSGGPLLQGGRLVGVVSWGDYYCGEGIPGVYVRVDRWKRWIRKGVRRWKRGWFRTIKAAHRPIREKSGWTMPRKDGFRILDGFTYGEGLGDLRALGHQHTVVISSNRPVRGATISIAGNNKLCPGSIWDYSTPPSENADSDERCQSSFAMRPTPGGEEASWTGWASDHQGECPRVTVRATIAGKPYRKTYYSCDVRYWKNK